ncbi:MAG: hypothetical protein J0M29_15065 [Chitinophagales bacterium]|nr:hypothetical protein [Chitinophagales bacterium]
MLKSVSPSLPILFCGILCLMLSGPAIAQNPKNPAKAPAMESAVYCHQVAEVYGKEMQEKANQECKTMSQCMPCTDHDTGTKTCKQLTVFPNKESMCHDSIRPVAGFKKTACMGKCPTYTVTIFANGAIQWEGIAYTQPLGKKNGKISPDMLEALREKARSIGFLQLNDMYPADPIADASATVVFLELDGKYKQVGEIFGAPKGLKELHKMFEDLIKKQGWNKPAQMKKKLDTKPKSTVPGTKN